MASNLSVSCEQISNTSNSATFRCTITANSSSYYGLVSPCIAIKTWNGYRNYWGFPLSNHWKSSWHASPDYRLVNGSVINGAFGSLNGQLTDRTYTWTETVPINKGNSRQGTATITVGAQYNGNDSRFASALITKTLNTTSTPYGEITSKNCTVDSGNTSGTRYIHITCNFTNPENYHTCKLFDASGKLITATSVSPLTYNITITKDMYQKTKAYKLELYGKDNNACPGAQTIYAFIEPSGVGLWTKQNSNTKEVSTATFKNVNQKQITEIWIRKNQEWKRTLK